MPGFRRDGIIAWRKGRAVSHREFLAQVLDLAERLPETRHVINLCEDRYLFTLALCAALVRDTATLLPPNRLAGTVADIAARYPGAITMADAAVEGLPTLDFIVEAQALPEPCALADPLGPPLLSERPDAILAFTSGSTGTPQPNLKRWLDQMVCSRCAVKRFGIRPDAHIIATVPPQHMFGLELSVLIPMAIGAAAHSARPFFPEDVRSALAETPGSRVLVTTPVHLKSLVAAEIDWPDIDLVISATAPLSHALAEETERRLKTRVFEIYGCTEAGSVASRRTIDGPTWEWYDSVRPSLSPDGTLSLTADFLPGAVSLSDRIELDGDRHFRLLGRGEDMVNVAGKRASLADLNLRLNSVQGVDDGIVVMPESGEETSTRLAAVVVAPALDRASLMAALRERIDPVFLPRRVLFVDSLPRNDVGKIPRQWLLDLLAAKGGADQH